MASSVILETRPHRSIEEEHLLGSRTSSVNQNLPAATAPDAFETAGLRDTVGRAVTIVGCTALAAAFIVPSVRAFLGANKQAVLCCQTFCKLHPAISANECYQAVTSVNPVLVEGSVVDIPCNYANSIALGIMGILAGGAISLPALASFLEWVHQRPGRQTQAPSVDESAV